MFGVFGMGQEIPMPTSRVTLAEVRDRWGRPGAALRKNVHRTSVEVEDGMAAMGEEWLLAAGARQIHRQRGTATASAAGEHSCGTARMGTDPGAVGDGSVRPAVGHPPDRGLRLVAASDEREREPDAHDRGERASAWPTTSWRTGRAERVRAALSALVRRRVRRRAG